MNEKSTESKLKFERKLGCPLGTLGSFLRSVNFFLGGGEILKI
jgi:hypothetical protein